MENEAVTWTAVAIALISLIGTVATMVNERLKARDKMAFDAKLIDLENKNKRCEEQHAECEERTAKVEAKNAELEKKHEKTATDLELIKAKLNVRTDPD